MSTERCRRDHSETNVFVVRCECRPYFGENRVGKSFMLMYQMHFFCTFACPARPAAGRFSCCRLRDTQGGRNDARAHVWAPAGLGGACSGRPKSRELPLFRGISFSPSRVGPWKNTTSASRSAAVSYITCPLKLSHSLRCGSHGSIAVAHQASPFVTATDSASVCACVP